MLLRGSLIVIHVDHIKALSQAHLRFESCNPIGENIEIVPRDKRFQGECREHITPKCILVHSRFH
jgi:hypothetical protein